jgi:hypothetical protein
MGVSIVKGFVLSAVGISIGLSDAAALLAGNG